MTVPTSPLERVFDRHEAMRHHRVRPTLLLRVLLTTASLAAFVGVVAAFGGRPMSAAAAFAFLLAWFFALELERLWRLLDFTASLWASRQALIGCESENDWFEYQLENNPEFLERIAAARDAIRRGEGIRLENVAG